MQLFQRFIPAYDCGRKARIGKWEAALEIDCPDTDVDLPHVSGFFFYVQVANALMAACAVSWQFTIHRVLSWRSKAQILSRIVSLDTVDMVYVLIWSKIAAVVKLVHQTMYLVLFPAILRDKVSGFMQATDHFPIASSKQILAVRVPKRINLSERESLRCFSHDHLHTQYNHYMGCIA